MRHPTSVGEKVNSQLPDRKLFLYTCQVVNLLSRQLNGLRPRSFKVVATLLLLLAFPLSLHAARKPALAPVYDHWLHVDAKYIITNDERDLFLKLPTDRERDLFIENFWKIRSPDPNSPVNAYRDEHYRRIAYANEHFGARGLDQGWDTDRGMVYITLGAPQQRSAYLGTKYLRPLEIWFYQSPGGGLPSYFYVVFYKPSISEDYRLYSPYQNKPEALIASTNAVNDEKAAVKIIDTDLGPEVARTVISLLPTEPVDTKNPEPSLESDVILNRIREYRNTQENRELLSIRRSQLEGVSHRILLDEQFSDLAVLATRDSGDYTSIHYLFRFWHPQDFSLAEQADGRYYYSLHLESQLLGPDNKIIYKDEQEMQHVFTKAQVDTVRDKSFGIEDRLAAAPGKYQLHVVLTNNITHQAFSQTRAVVVPRFTGGLGLSRILFASPKPPFQDASHVFPFSLSGVKLWPVGSDNAAIAPNEPLRFVVQIWLPPGDASAQAGKKLDVDTLIGRLNSPEKQTDTQSIDRGSFDANGNMVYGKDIATQSLAPGSYRLVVKVTDPDTHETTAEAANFTLRSEGAASLWTARADSYGKQQDSVTNLYRSGVCAIAQGDAPLAIHYLKPLGEAGLETHEALDALARAYRMAGQAELAQAAERRRDTLPAQR